MARADIKHGKEFEKTVHKAFRLLYEKHPIHWERVVDTHDAGDIIRKSDCDFKLTINSGTDGQPYVFYIECKASINYTSLTNGGARRALISADQIAKMRIAERAGAKGLYMFHSVNTGIVEVWDATEVNEMWALKRFKWVSKPRSQFHIDKLPEWAIKLILHFLRKSK